jgi:hypothetical protein
MGSRQKTAITALILFVLFLTFFFLKMMVMTCVFYALSSIHFALRVQ